MIYINLVLLVHRISLSCDCNDHVLIMSRWKSWENNNSNIIDL